MENIESNRHARLFQLDALPEGFLECPVNRLDSVLEGPTLIRLRGERPQAVFVSVLLHGNEVSGLLAVQLLLKDFQEKGAPLPRDLWIFVGNTEAARYGVRRLPGQPDYNRIWAGGDEPECRMAEQLLAELESQPLFMALDIHNNSGKNPVYGCINQLDPHYIHLARRFSPMLVYFTEPHEVLGIALSRLCPAATLECGTSGLPDGITRVVRLLGDLLAAKEPEDVVAPEGPVDVYHTVAKVTVEQGCSVGFGPQPENYDLCFPEELETLNFRHLPTGTFLGWATGPGRCLKVTDNPGSDVTEEYLCREGNRILTRRPCVLSMLTSDITVIHQDCLCYIMEPYPL